MNGSLQKSAQISGEFDQSARVRKPDRRKRTPPVSIRFSDDERQLLTSYAGDKPLSSYVRDYVMRAHNGKTQKRNRISTADPKQSAQLLGMLGRSELTSQLREILNRADHDTFFLDRNTEAQLRKACAEIIDMRQMLMKGLGLRNDASP